MSVCIKPFSLTVGGGPAAWFRMEEAAGDRIDAVNGIHLPLVSGSPAATRVAGKIAFGMNFTQATAHSPLYETAPNAKFAYQAKGFDQYCWVAVGVAGQTFFFCDYLIGAGVEEFYLQFATGTIEMNSINFGPLGSIGFPVVPLNTYHLVRFYYNPTTSKVGIQIDNGPKTEVNYPGGVLAVQPFGAVALEASTGAGDSINISIDEHSIWLASAPSDAIAAQVWAGGAGHTYPL